MTVVFTAPAEAKPEPNVCGAERRMISKGAVSWRPVAVIVAVEPATIPPTGMPSASRTEEELSVFEPVGVTGSDAREAADVPPEFVAVVVNV